MKKRGAQAKSVKSSLFHNRLAEFQHFFESPYISALSALLFVATVAMYFWTGRDDYDLFWHLRYGEHFVSHHTWNVNQAEYSWTPVVIKWKYCTWLGSSILYLLFNSFSMEGLLVLKWLLFYGVFGLCILFIRAAGERFDTVYVAAFFLMAVTFKLNGDYLKPERFSDFLFVLTVFIYAYSKVKDTPLFYLYPLLFLFWVNTHGGFLNGMVFITLALFAEAVNTLILKKGRILPGRILVFFGISVILSYMVTLINPSGIEYHLSLFKEYTTPGSAAAVATTRLYAWLSMWQFLFPSQNNMKFLYINTAWCIVIMFMLFCAVSLYAFRKRNYLDIASVVLNIFFFYLAMKLSRATLYYPVVWFFTLLTTMKNAELLSLRKKYSAPAFFLSLFWFVLIAHTYVTDCRWTTQGNFFDFVPQKEVSFMKKYHLPGPIFNDYLSGGYLIWAAWPEYKVFVDPRQAPFMDTVLPDYFNFIDHPSVEKLTELNEKYPFKTALIHWNELMTISIFAQSSLWRLVYFDKNAAVFVHISQYDLLPEEARNAYSGASRFREVKNPVPLAFLFEMYIHYNINDAEEIYRIYCANVSDLNVNKDFVVKNMQARLAQVKGLQK
ncbi:MAG: hypothetical protein AB9903_29295 [Vulcanimicrobiota bacterium]